MLRVIGREDKRRLGKIQFFRDRLHERIRDSPAVGENGQRITAKVAVSENIDEVISA